jgi:nesprin-1
MYSVLYILYISKWAAFRYIQSNPEIKNTIEKQHKNMQESYNSLQQTGVQIKNRLLDSLEKFDEYESTLQSIMDNIKQWEPDILRDLQKPLENISSIESEMENIRVSIFKIFFFCIFQFF